VNQQTPATSRSGSGFRLDIQGLRAVAVLLVVAFHADLPVPGGFVGVDVFFVISGYVITNMLLREWHEFGRIRLARFWRRRFFRLTPALALMIGVTFVLSALILFPSEQRVAFQTGIGALFLAANIVIARNTGGYFDPPADGNPLLNTWSLSVEEQFYLLFPLLLAAALVAWRKSSRLRWAPLVLVMSVGAISFGLTLWSNTASGQAVTWLNFYSPFTRSWEFAAGSILALATWGRDPIRAVGAKALALTGGLGLVASAFLINETTPFPSTWTLLPVLSTSLLLAAGAAVDRRHTILANPAMVRIGDWSYSIYLWHWPFIVFAIALGLWQPAWLVLAATASFIPAVVSYRFVEQPLRRWSPTLTRSRIVAAASILAVPVALVPVLLATATPAPRFQGSIGTQYLQTIETTSYPCEIPQIPGSGSRCYQSQPTGPISAVVVGDSHAEHLYLGVKDQLPDLNVAYVYLPNWPYDTSENSMRTFDAIAATPSIQAVIINSRWDEEGASSPEVTQVLEQVAGSGTSVFVADDGPTFSFHAEECQYQRKLAPRPRCEEDSAAFIERYAAYRPLLDDQVDGLENATILETSNGFCEGGRCQMTDGDLLLFADHGHLNEVGSELVIARLLSGNLAFQAATQAPASGANRR